MLVYKNNLSIQLISDSIIPIDRGKIVLYDHLYKRKLISDKTLRDDKDLSKEDTERLKKIKYLCGKGELKTKDGIVIEKLKPENLENKWNKFCLQLIAL